MNKAEDPSAYWLKSGSSTGCLPSIALIWSDLKSIAVLVFWASSSYHWIAVQVLLLLGI